MARLKQTYAPVSFYSQIEEFVFPQQGEYVEIIVSWKERLIESFTIRENGIFKFSSFKSSLMDTLPAQDRFLMINSAGARIFIPGNVNAKKVKFDEASSQKTVETLSMGIYSLDQGEQISMGFNNHMQITIRRNPIYLKAPLKPLFDISSDGFLSFGLAVCLSCILALIVNLQPKAKGASYADDFMAPLVLENPMRLAQVIQKQISVSAPKIQRKKEATKKTTSSGIKTSQIEKTAIASKKSKGLKLATGGSPSKHGTGNSKLMSVMSSYGQQEEQSLVNLANQMRGKGGKGDDSSFGFSSRMRKIGNGKREEKSVGLSQISNLGDAILSAPTQSLGGKKSLAIQPEGEGLSVSGTIDRNGIRQVFINNARVLRSCYERGLNKNSGLGGKIVLDFTVGARGVVLGKPKIAQKPSTLTQQALVDCLVGRVRTWQFPAPPHNQEVRVLYPLAFSPGR